MGFGIIQLSVIKMAKS